jgi:fructokinase
MMVGERDVNPPFDLLALGEALVDLISTTVTASLSEARTYNRFMGGQVTNLAVNMALLGKRSTIAACVGEDGFGRFLKGQIENSNVITDHLQFTAEAPTSLSIMTRETQTADFLIARGADAYLRSTPAIEAAAASSRIVHASAFGLSREPARTTILNALQIAHEAGGLVSLDPNYHPKIWPDTSDFPAILKEAYRYATLSKPSLDDCSRLFGHGQEPADYVRKFLDWGCQIVALTMGARGLLLATSSGDLYHVQSNAIPVVDATGAGDAFWAGFLTELLNGAAVVDAARMGQVVAEIKLGKVGPLNQLPDADVLRRRSADIRYVKVVT